MGMKALWERKSSVLEGSYLACLRSHHRREPRQRRAELTGRSLLIY